MRCQEAIRSFIDGVCLMGASVHDTSDLLRRVFNRANRVARRVLPRGDHPRDFAILRVLAGRDAYSQQELGDQLGVNRTIMVNVLDRLENAGWVRRVRNPLDRRSYTLSVTASGRRAMATMAPVIAKGEIELTIALTAAERRRLNDLLRTVLPDQGEERPHPQVEGSAYLLVQAHYLVRRRRDEALVALGIQSRHFAALAALDATGPCPQAQLAGELGVAEPAVVQIVDHLQSAGLVERRRDPVDRRRYALQLTAVGRRQLRKARRALGGLDAEITDVLTEAGHRELDALLIRLLQAP